MRISDWSSDVCSSDLDESSLEVDLLAMGLHAEHVGGEGGLEQIGQRRGGPAVDQLSRRPMRVGKTAEEGAEPGGNGGCADLALVRGHVFVRRSEEHTSELQSLMRISYAVFCLKKKTT